MENIAIIQLNESSLKLSIYSASNGHSKLIEEKEQPIKLGEEIFQEELMRPKTRNDILEILGIYRTIMGKYNVEKVTAVVSHIITKARNYRGFIEEVYNTTGISLTILSEEESNKFVYQSVLNNIDSSKGIILNIGEYSTSIIKYNRRNIVSTDTISYGSANLLVDSNGGKRTYEDMLKLIRSKAKALGFKLSADEEGVFVGCGKAFITVGRIAKKIARYPLELDNNYQLDKDVMERTSNFVGTLELEKVGKIKGIDEIDATRVLSSTAIVEGLMKELAIEELTISTSSLQDGIALAQCAVPNQDKLNDIISNSLDCYYEFSKNEHSNNLDVYAMALVLFKQLKVMHKLPRYYIKPLRVAAFMFDAGKVVNFSNYAKHGFDIILYSNVNGLTHRELLIAAFICLCQEVDNFSLNDWVKYKDILQEEDLEAVRKLGIVVKLAVALNASKKNNITDVVCDILGDSIIMKTVVKEGTNANFEIMEGMKVAVDYRKVYKKSLQII